MKLRMSCTKLRYTQMLRHRFSCAGTLNMGNPSSSDGAWRSSTSATIDPSAIAGIRN